MKQVKVVFLLTINNENSLVRFLNEEISLTVALIS